MFLVIFGRICLCFFVVTGQFVYSESITERQRGRGRSEGGRKLERQINK